MKKTERVFEEFPTYSCEFCGISYSINPDDIEQTITNINNPSQNGFETVIRCKYCNSKKYIYSTIDK